MKITINLSTMLLVLAGANFCGNIVDEAYWSPVPGYAQIHIVKHDKRDDMIYEFVDLPGPRFVASGCVDLGANGDTVYMKVRGASAEAYREARKFTQIQQQLKDSSKRQSTENYDSEWDRQQN